MDQRTAALRRQVIREELEQQLADIRELVMQLGLRVIVLEQCIAEELS